MPRTALILKGSIITLFLFTLLLPLKRQDFVAFLIYYAPYIVALFLPNRYIGYAAGICLGTVAIELPFTAVFSFFGGIFPDPKAFLPLRIISILLLLVALSGLVVYLTSQKKERTN